MEILLRLRLQLAQLMLQLLMLQQKVQDKRLALYETAKACLGRDMAPIHNAFGCAEALNEVFKKTFGVYAGGDVSTYRMYHALQDPRRFMRVSPGLPGDIIISPTGYGTGKIPNGHVGILSDNDRIMSNNSASGLWDEHFDIKSWNTRYKTKGGFPVEFYRPV